MTFPPRFAIARAAIEGNRARLTGPELHHLRNVTRLRPGAVLALLDEDGREYAGRLVELNDADALIAITAVKSAAPARRIILAGALIKAPRMDFLVEKAAELGASELLPLHCARSITQTSAERLARWRRLAVAAAKQSNAPLMEIRPALTVSEMVGKLAPHTLHIICAPDGAPLAHLLSVKPAADLLLAIGPEGDFTAEERAAMLAAGCLPASLGPHRLRSETAALAALSIAAAIGPELRDAVKSANK